MDGQKTILIVDDNPNYSFIWKEFCEDEGHRVITADNAAQAQAAIDREPRIDLIMTDLVMPGMSGYEFIQQLRGASETRTTPIILMTATAKVIHDLAQNEGATMLSKSVETQVVLRRIREALYPGGKAADPLARDAQAPAPVAPSYQIVQERFVDFVPQQVSVSPWVPPSKP